MRELRYNVTSWGGRRDSVEVARAAMATGRALVAMPSANPSMGCTLEVVGLSEQGWLLSITDPAGAPVWSILLEGAELPGGAGEE